MSQTKLAANEELASGQPGSSSNVKPMMRISSSPSSSILNERRRHLRPSNSSNLPADNQSNITIIDCRHTQGADENPLKLISESLQAATTTSTAASEKPERKSTFDQFKSSLGLGERRRRPELQRDPPLIEIPPTNVKILDIRRTKTNRKRPKQQQVQRLSNEYENVAPQCQLARNEDEEDDDQNEANDNKSPVGESSDQVQPQRADAIRNKIQKQQQEQQRQQSGETLSSFESDYDLLVYLGETETEDLVETERSLDYLDQTWRQSICGGSSLAPTLDESFGDLLQTPQNRFATIPRSPTEHNEEFEQLWTTPIAANASQSRTAQQVAVTTSTSNPSKQRATSNRLAAPNRGDCRGDLLSDLSSGWSASLPRQASRLEPLKRTQTEVKSLERRTNNDPELVSPSSVSIGNPTSKQVADSGTAQSQRSAASLGNKLVSLFGRNSAATITETKQQQVPAGLSEREAETVRQLNEFLEQVRLSPAQMEAPRKPRRRQQTAAGQSEREVKVDENADELDRLLAEMSQSLDLDSLARYDPCSRQVELAKGMATSDGPVSQRKQLKTQTVEVREAKVMPLSDRNEAILNEYDGASRILEQMINDQLNEPLDSRRNTQQVRNVPQIASRKMAENKRERSIQSLKQANEHPIQSSSEPAPNEDRISSSSLVHKISFTGSSTGTTETSVVPATPQRSTKLTEEARTTRRSSVSGQNRGPSHLKEIGRKPSSFSRSLDVNPEAAQQARDASQKVATATNSGHFKLPTSNIEAPDEGDDEEEEEDESRDIPPRPPAVDYHDFEVDKLEVQAEDGSTKDSCGPDYHQEGVGQALIQVEANELPTPTSSEDEHEENDSQQRRRPSWSKRHKQAMSRVKQRTLSGVRSVRQHFNKRPQDGPNEREIGHETVPDGIHELRPDPPTRSRSIGSSSRSVSSQNRNVEASELVEETRLAIGAESQPRQSRQRARRAPTEMNKLERPVEGGKKSFGRQMRERLSRSKSRLSKFLRPLSLHRNSQATPVEDHEEANEKRPSLPLFQPGDIARNELPACDESSLERQLKADLYDEARDETKRLQAERSPATSRDRSRESEKSQGSGNLSGLETVDKQREGLFDLALGRKFRQKQRKSRPQQRRTADQQSDRPNQKRPVSLMSLKRIGDTFGRTNRTANETPEVQDLDQQMAAAAAVVHRKRNKRARNRSTGDQRNSPPGQIQVQSVVSPRATTDDYFGFKAPLKTSSIEPDRAQRITDVHQRVELGPRVRPVSAMMLEPRNMPDLDQPQQQQQQQRRRFLKRRNGRIPNRSQSLRGSDFDEAKAESRRREVTPKSSAGAQNQAQHSKSVSFQNLAPSAPVNQRRPLSPVSPNTFRPITASPGVEHLELDSAATSSRPDPGSITPIPLVPILANHSDISASANAPSRTTAKSHTLLQDLRNKCSDLFTPDHKRRPSSSPQRPPVRPPRNRKRRAQGQTLPPSGRSRSLAAQTAPPHMIQLEPSSPPVGLLTASESPEPRRELVQQKREAVSRRLTNFANQLRTSAADFFAGGGQFKRQASDLGPASRRVAQTATSVERRPHFWNLDEPLEQRDLAQWRPIIPVGGDRSRTGPISKNERSKARRSSSFRVPKAQRTEDEADHQQSGTTLAGDSGGHEATARTRNHLEDSYSDSTWDSSCSEAESEAGDQHKEDVQSRARDYNRLVHDDDSSQSKQQQVTGSLDRGGGGGADLQRQTSDERITQADSKPRSPSSSIGRHDKNKDRDRNNNDNHICNDVTQSDEVLPGSHNSKQLQPEANKVIGSNPSEHLEEVGKASASLPPPGDGSRGLLSNEDKTQDRSNLSGRHLFEKDNSNKFIGPLQAIGSVNERAFKFNESLPSPNQILSEIKRESGGDGGEQQDRQTTTMTATRSARRVHALADGGGGKSSTKNSHLNSDQIQSEEENANRLSVYENVSPRDTRNLTTRDDNLHPTSQTKGDKPEQTAKASPLTKRQPSPLISSEAFRQVDEDNSGSSSSREADDWAVESDVVQEPKRISDNLKATASSTDETQGQLKTILRSTENSQISQAKVSSGANESVQQANVRRAERKLVPMTSIIHEPEDELMNLETSKSSAEKQEAAGDLLRRQSSYSINQANGNSDNDESESSLYLGNVRLRLEKKLAMQRDQLSKQTSAKPPVPTRPPNLPRGRESLVKRMAKNFDQTARDHQQKPVACGPQFGSAATSRRSNASVVQPELAADEPKSDSTWYDAKSVELLDEAEVAELLREFESGNSNNDHDDENSDQFVTLSQDQTGRRDARRRERPDGHAEDDDEDDDATLNDDETLNDADDADDPFEVSNENNNQDEDESVYISAATGTTNENLSPTAVAPAGNRVGRLVEEFQRQQQQQQQQQASARFEAVGRLGAGCEKREAFVSLLGGRADRRRCSGDPADGRDEPHGIAPVACDDGCERKACASKREQRVETHSTTTTKQKTNATADQNHSPPAMTRPVDETESPTPTKTNAIPLTRNDDHDHLESSSMEASCQMQTGRQDANDDERRDESHDRDGDGPLLFPSGLSRSASASKELESVRGSGQDDEDGDDSNGANTNVDLSSGHSSGGCHEDLISLSSSSLSSESMPELRQRKNLQRLYNIVNEICSSEETFLATLKLLNEDFKRHILRSLPASTAQAESLSNADVLVMLQQQPPFDCIALIMKHLPQLQTLNQNLLDELRQARNQWPSTQKISHVLVKIGPFLKHYSSYIRDFEFIQQQFQENLKKSQQFRDTIRRFECEHADQFNQLSIQHHLLKPIQRIPQYRLLLQQYLHHLKPDDADYEDTVEALEVVSRVAEHANQSLSEGANFARLLSLQAKIVAGKQRDLIQPGRLFIKEGELLKVCRKQIQPRWFVLLSDALLYLKAIQLNDILYLKYELPLEDCQVELPTPMASEIKTGPEEKQDDGAKQNHDRANDEGRECELNICTTVRSMTLIARNRQERDDWFQALSSAIEQHKAKRRSFRAGQRRDSVELEEPFNGLIGRKAPIWTPDSRVSTCQLCTSSFSALFRRHHCRACGRVVCSACSSNKAPLIYLKCRAARVCDQCFESLRANMHLYYLPSCQIDERELRRLDEHFKILLKSQFVKRRMFASSSSSSAAGSKVPKVVLLKGKPAASCATGEKRA